MNVAHNVENIIMNIVRARKEGKLQYIQGVTATDIMTRATENDAAVNILTYLSTGEVVNAVLVVRR